MARFSSSMTSDLSLTLDDSTQQGWTADDYEIGVKGMSADFSERPNSPGDDDVRGDGRTVATTNIQTQRNVASEGEPQEEVERENVAKEPQKEGEEQNIRERSNSIAASISAVRSLPVVNSRPTQGLQRLEMEQNCGA